MTGEVKRKAFADLPQDIKECVYNHRVVWLDFYRNMPMDEFISMYNSILIDDVMYRANWGLLSHLKREDFVRNADGEYRIKLIQCADFVSKDGEVLKNRHGRYGKF